MYSQDADFKTPKNAPSNQPIYLYTIYNYDGASTNLTLAEYDADVVYDGITYTKFPIKHDEIGENSSGEIDTFRVTVANVNRVLQAYLELYDFRGKQVTITLVWADKLADADAHIDFIFYIDTYTANEQTIDFTLSSKFDLLNIELPFSKYNRNFCRWKFKSTECGYSGAQTSCDKRKTTCLNTMANVLRYGGFPSIPTSRIFI